MSTPAQVAFSPQAPSLEPSNSYTGPHNLQSVPLLEGDPTGAVDQEEGETTWTTLRAAMSPLRSRRKLWRMDIGDSEKLVPWKRKGLSRSCMKVGGGILLVLGIIQAFSLIGSLVLLILPDGVHRIVKSWGRPGHVGFGLSSWPTDFSRDILPIPCHSHNDYWRTVPLYSAIKAGCIGVEADIWLFDETLYVGHSIPSLTPNRTLNSLYIDPLLDILSKQNPKQSLIPTKRESQLNGVFDTHPEQSLIFLIDFKTAGAQLWPYVQSALEQLRARKYLTHHDGNELIQGPITVVGTGNAPFDLVLSDKTNPHHDIFFDSPLDLMYEGSEGPSSSKQSPPEVEQGGESPGGASTTKPLMEGKHTKRSDEGGQGKSGIAGDVPNNFNISNSFYASVAFSEAIGQVWDVPFSDHQMDLLRGQIRGAHKRGLTVRYWDLPFWPIGLRNHVWDVLIKEGVDMLNVDDLKGATKRDWKKHRGWWKGEKGKPHGIHD